MRSQNEAGRGEPWFEELYRAHHAAILSYARRRVADPDDVTAEVFSTAWRSRDRVPDPPLAWLYRTASNHILHAYRGEARRTRLGRHLTHEAATVPDHAERVADRLDASARVWTALDRLSPADRELLELLAWEDLPRDQIAFVVGCSTATLRVRLRRARLRFAAELDGLERAPAHPPERPTQLLPKETRP